MARLSTVASVTLRDGRELLVRSARARDAAALFALLEEVAGEEPPTLLLEPDQVEPRLWRRRIAAASRDAHSLFLVGEASGEVVANLSFERDGHPNAGHVAWLGVAVDGDWRGQGVGSALLEVAVDWAREAGVSKLVLGVFPENARALVFYERHGFVREGLRRGHYLRAGRYHDEVLMARQLVVDGPDRPI